MDIHVVRAGETVSSVAARYGVPAGILAGVNGVAPDAPLAVGQTLVIRRIVDDEKIHAVMQANAARKSKGKKSKFQQRYEELMRQQEAQQRAKRKKFPDRQPSGRDRTRLELTGSGQNRPEAFGLLNGLQRTGRRRNL